MYISVSVLYSYPEKIFDGICLDGYVIPTACSICCFFFVRRRGGGRWGLLVNYRISTNHWRGFPSEGYLLAFGSMLVVHQRGEGQAMSEKDREIFQDVVVII